MGNKSNKIHNNQNTSMTMTKLGKSKTILEILFRSTKKMYLAKKCKRFKKFDFWKNVKKFVMLTHPRLFLPQLSVCCQNCYHQHLIQFELSTIVDLFCMLKLVRFTLFFCSPYAFFLLIVRIDIFVFF